MNATIYRAFVDELGVLDKESSTWAKWGPGKMNRLRRKAAVTSEKAQRTVIKRSPAAAMAVAGSLGVLGGAQGTINPHPSPAPVGLVKRLSKPEIDKHVAGRGAAYTKAREEKWDSVGGLKASRGDLKRVVKLTQDQVAGEHAFRKSLKNRAGVPVKD